MQRIYLDGKFTRKTIRSKSKAFVKMSWKKIDFFSPKKCKLDRRKNHFSSEKASKSEENLWQVRRLPVKLTHFTSDFALHPKCIFFKVASVIPLRFKILPKSLSTIEDKTPKNSIGVFKFYLTQKLMKIHMCVKCEIKFPNGVFFYIGSPKHKN